ncbi:MAG: MAE_28990/MAE_18760 family HEPN-like nuclease [Thalassotalea sp.]|nr:MAE_28990/MAE_18760 family HEPN-like nuclease [Thalassotalea sp.]
MSRIDSWYLYQERVEDINTYFEFLFSVLDNRPVLKYNDREESFDRNLLHILKANGFVIVYNLIESTVCNAIEDIHKELKRSDALCADKLNVELAKRAFKRVNDQTISQANLEGTSVGALIVQEWLKEHDKSVSDNKNPLFSGNVDARKIREVAEIYGFSTETNQEETRNGASLVKIKTTRNELAHGADSFKDKGQQTSPDELKRMKEEVICYLRDMLINIEKYLTDKEYLREAFRRGA